MTSPRFPGRTLRQRGFHLAASVVVALTPAGLYLLSADTATAGLLDPASAAQPAIGSGAECDAPSTPPNPVIAEVLARVNSDRAAAGAEPLAWNPQLYCLALQWSTTQGEADTLRHRDLMTVIRSRDYGRYRTLGENLLRGPAGIDGDRMHDEWMNSPLHRANVLQTDYTSIGIALHYTDDGRVYATENFGG